MDRNLKQSGQKRRSVLSASLVAFFSLLALSSMSIMKSRPRSLHVIFQNQYESYSETFHEDLSGAFRIEMLTFKKLSKQEIARELVRAGWSSRAGEEVFEYKGDRRFTVLLSSIPRRDSVTTFVNEEEKLNRFSPIARFIRDLMPT